MAFTDVRTKLVSELDSEQSPDPELEYMLILDKNNSLKKIRVLDFQQSMPGLTMLDDSVLLLDKVLTDKKNPGTRGVTSNYQTDFFVRHSHGDWGSWAGNLIVDEIVPDYARAVYVTAGNLGHCRQTHFRFRFTSYNPDNERLVNGNMNPFYEHQALGGEKVWTRNLLHNHTAHNQVAKDVAYAIDIIPSYDADEKKWRRVINVSFECTGRSYNHPTDPMNRGDACRLYVRGYWQ